MAADPTPQRQLPITVQLHILSFLGPNEHALSGRLVSPALAQALGVPQHCTASLSHPLPPHSVPWAVEAGQQHVRQLSFERKPKLLCTAAASGSEANLEVALALLQPSVFPEALQEHGDAWPHFNAEWRSCNPGQAAVKAGHLQLLGWLLNRCPGLLCASSVLVTAAKHCSLAGLQADWGLLHARVEAASSDGDRAIQGMLDAAAESVTPDAFDKMEWLLDISRGRCRLQDGTAEAAARSGDLGRLRWLQDRGCPMGGTWVLVHALPRADLAMAQWLVAEAGFGFPSAPNTQAYWGLFREAAASSPDAAAKLQWLQEQGAPLADETEMQSLLLREALEAGQVRQLADAGYLRKEGFGFAGWAEPCARAGNVALARWMVREAHVPINRSGLQYVLQSWPDGLPAHSRGLLEVAQLLVGEAECRDWDAERTLCTAARQGDLALVQYLLQQRPEYQPRGKVLVAASDSGCEALLEWLVEQHPSCRDTGRDSAYYAALRTGDLGTLAALRWLGVPWGAPDILLGALGSPVESPVLRWLVEQGAPVGSNNRNDKRRAAAFLRGGRLDPSVTAVSEAWVGQS